MLSEAGILKVFETQDGSIVAGIDPNRRPIYDFAFSPEGRDLILRHDGELSVWDLKFGEEYLRTAEASREDLGNRNRILKKWLPFSPDGEWILAETPGLKKIPQDPPGQAAQRVPRSMTSAEIQRYSLITSPETHSDEKTSGE